MSVLFDAVASTVVANNAGTTLSWTHTPVGVPTSVGVTLFNYTGGTSVTGVTYGGLALTLEVVSPSIGALPSRTEIWGSDGLTLPTGAQTVVVTFSTTGSYCQAASVTVTGSDKTTCFSNVNNATGTSAAPSIAVNSAVGEFVIDITGNDANDNTIAPGGSQILRWGPLQASNNWAAGSSLPAGAGSTTMSWTSANEAWAICAASFKAASVGVTPTAGMAASEW